MEEQIRYERGQIYYVKFDDSIGSELSVGRPALILSNDETIEKLNTVLVAFMTTTPRKSKGIVKILLNGKPGYIMCNQIQTLDKSRLSSFKCKLGEDVMRRVETALMYSFGCAPVNAEEEEVEEEKIVESNPSAELIVAKKESELYQNLYTKAMARLAEIQFDYDMLRLEKKIEKQVVAEPTPEPKIVEVKPEPEPEKLDLSGLKKVARVREEKPVGRKVNINTATAEEIHEISGLGKWYSTRIVQHRNKCGKYKSVESLLELKELSRSNFDRVAPFMEV